LEGVLGFEVTSTRVCPTPTPVIKASLVCFPEDDDDDDDDGMDEEERLEIEEEGYGNDRGEGAELLDEAELFRDLL